MTNPGPPSGDPLAGPDADMGSPESGTQHATSTDYDPLGGAGADTDRFSLDATPPPAVPTPPVYDDPSELVDVAPGYGSHEADPVPAYGTDPAPAYGTDPVPAYGTDPTPAFEADPIPAYGTDPAPAYGTDPAPAYGTDPAPAYDGDPIPAYEGDPIPAYEGDPIPAYEGDPIPVYGTDRVPAYDEPTPAYDALAEEAAFAAPLPPTTVLTVDYDAGEQVADTGLLAKVKAFAAEKPAAFLGAALLAGWLVGKLLSSDDD